MGVAHLWPTFFWYPFSTLRRQELQYEKKAEIRPDSPGSDAADGAKSVEGGGGRGWRPTP